jgi:hypothetical protein
MRNLIVYNSSGAFAVARNAALKALPARLLLLRLDWLFDWKPD